MRHRRDVALAQLEARTAVRNFNGTRARAICQCPVVNLVEHATVAVLIGIVVDVFLVCQPVTVVKRDGRALSRTPALGIAARVNRNSVLGRHRRDVHVVALGHDAIARIVRAKDRLVAIFNLRKRSLIARNAATT